MRTRSKSDRKKDHLLSMTRKLIKISLKKSKLFMKILIGGMGRSGTSLLSKMFIELGASGLEISSDLDPDIAAGCEASITECLTFLNSPQSGVVKSPFIYEICHSSEFCSANIDLVIIPIRDPKMATMSRLVNELRAICFSDQGGTLEQSFGRVAAGHHYFMDKQEEMRTLSAGLVTLLHECSSKGIRTSFPPFPEIGRPEIAKEWANSIEDVTIKLGIQSLSIQNWLAANFKHESSSLSNWEGACKTFVDYTQLINESNGSPPNTQEFIIAHQKYIEKHNDKLAAINIERAQAMAQAEQAMAQAEQAMAQAEQAKKRVDEICRSKSYVLASRLQKLKSKLLDVITGRLHNLYSKPNPRHTSKQERACVAEESSNPLLWRKGLESKIKPFG